MKDICIGILLVTTVVFGALSVHEQRKEHQAEATMAQLNQDVAALQNQVTQEKEHAANFREQLDEATANAEAKSAELAQVKSAALKTTDPEKAQKAAKPASSETKSGNSFGDMLQKPEMREMVKAQQKLVFSGMVDKNYAQLFANLGLSPEQSATLKDLVLKKMLVDAGMGVSLLGSDMDATKRADLLQQAKTEKDGINDQIKQFLGDDGYTQFQAYEKSQPERMGVNMFKDQLASGPNPLQPDQESQLIQALGEERQSFKVTTDFSDKSKFNGDFASTFTDEKIDQWKQESEQLDERYLLRAQSILSPDQVTAFKSYLVTQNQMQEAGLKMAGQMFGPKPAAK